jgi:hypothetical protein
MKTTLRKAMLATLASAASIGAAQAGVLTYQGVTFASSWSGNVLTLEIDAARHTGDWARAQGLAALELDGIGNYTGVSVSAAPSGARSWTTSSSELTAKGCSGGNNGQAGSRLCFFGQQLTLGDDMVFSFTFSGSAIDAVEPHVKVEFVNNKGAKVGSLLSQTLPASPAPAATVLPPATPPIASTAPADAVQAAPETGSGSAAAGSPIAAAAVTEIPPPQDLAATPPSTLPVQTGVGAGAGSGKAEVAEPQSLALLLAGFGLMGIVGRRKRRG